MYSEREGGSERAERQSERAREREGARERGMAGGMEGKGKRVYACMCARLTTNPLRFILTTGCGVLLAGARGGYIYIYI